ncbi:MAG: tetratricopeptide repeat-containing sulfotransferase family protein, partial [Rhodanobacteraceae bacterium]
MTAATDRSWQRINRYIDSNQPAPARAALESLLLRDPGDTRAHLTLGALYAADGHPRAATREALAAARHPPGEAQALEEVITALIKTGEIVEARRLLALPAINESRSGEVLLQAAIHQQLIGDHDAAFALIRKAGTAGADGPAFRFYRATQRTFHGDAAGARADFWKCIAAAPEMGHAYVQLAQLRGHQDLLPTIDATLRRVERGSEDHAALEFARYRVLEDLRRPGEAWQALVEGNAVMGARVPHDAARESELFDQVIETCTPAFLQRAAISNSAGPMPIFVIGMPRSGTTVLERLLGNHSRVASAGELGDWPRALEYATDHHPRVMLDDVTLQRLPAIDWAAVGEMYLAQTRWRARGKPFFVDKLPRNWMLAGLIRLALPQARILH